MSLAESCASSPSMYASDSPSPAPSASQTPHHYTNGYHHNNGNAEFSRFGSPGPQNHMSPHAPPNQTPNSNSHADDHHNFIKRPLNAYMIWTVEERKRILAKDPKMKMNDVSRIMGEKWKSLTDKEKRPYFEQSKQYKLDHKRALKENPDLLYRPQRKKPGRGSLIKQDLPMENSPVPMTNGVTPNSQPRFNGCTTNVYQCQSSSQGLPQPPNGAVLVAQPVVYPSMQLQSTSQGQPMTVTFQTPQAPIQTVQRPSYQPQQMSSARLVQNPNPPVNASQMLDMYYTSLCQPAFPEPGETNNMAPPQYYLDQYQQLHLQAVTSQHGVPAYGSYGAM